MIVCSVCEEVEWDGRWLDPPPGREREARIVVVFYMAYGGYLAYCRRCWAGVWGEEDTP